MHKFLIGSFFVAELSLSTSLGAMNDPKKKIVKVEQSQKKTNEDTEESRKQQESRKMRNGANCPCSIVIVV